MRDVGLCPFHWNSQVQMGIWSLSPQDSGNHSSFCSSADTNGLHFASVFQMSLASQLCIFFSNSAYYSTSALSCRFINGVLSALWPPIGHMRVCVCIFLYAHILRERKEKREENMTAWRLMSLITFIPGSMLSKAWKDKYWDQRVFFLRYKIRI